MMQPARSTDDAQAILQHALERAQHWAKVVESDMAVVAAGRLTAAEASVIWSTLAQALALAMAAGVRCDALPDGDHSATAPVPGGVVRVNGSARPGIVALGDGESLLALLTGSLL